MRGSKKPGTPKAAVIAALVSLKRRRLASSPVTGDANSRLDVWRQNRSSRSARSEGGLPQMIAPLIAPIEMPATQSILKSARCNAS